MRAILDANVLISALLGWSAQRGAEVAVVRAAIEGRFPLVLPPELVKETRSTLATRIHLRKIVTPAAADAFLGLLIEVGFIPRELASPPPAICRDPRDDYLLAHAAAENAGSSSPETRISSRWTIRRSASRSSGQGSFRHC